MVQHLPTGYALDLADPRAPTHDQWALMSPRERAAELEGKLVLEQRLREEAERRLPEALAEIERRKQS